jgi:hypothetical protein
VIKLTLGGVTEQQHQWRQLPAVLASETQAEADARARTVAVAIAAAYPVRSGALAAGMTVKAQPSMHKARAVIVNTARHALLYDIGSGPRTTRSGASRGAMPGAHVFIPRVMEARAALRPRIAAIMRKEGLTVSGA